MFGTYDLLSLVRNAGDRLGDAPFLTVGEESISGRQFQHRVEQAAAGFCADGLQPGDRVAVLLHRSIDEALALLAAAAAGGIAVPINGKLRDDQVTHLLADAEPFAVVTSAVRRLGLHHPERTLAGRRLYRVGNGDLGSGVRGFAELRGDASTLATPSPGDAAVLLYTSGSTGLQKGVVQSHHNLALGAAIVAEYLELTARDHLLLLLPMSFDYGLNQLLSALHTGCRITAADHLGTGELAELLLRVQPTGLAGVPSLWHEVAAGLSSGVLSAAHGASLRYVTNSGGTLRRTDSAVLRATWPWVRVFAMYGLTEAFRSAFLPPDEFDRHPESFGRAIAGVELLLVDPDSGAVLEGPATGELVHAGALVGLGYWRRPEDTRQRFRRDPRGGAAGGATVVYSGDLVRRDDEGRHWFQSRLDRLLKVHGHRVSPDEVASAFHGQDGVGEVGVFGVAGAVYGHHIVLAVAGDPADSGLVPRLRQRARARLPSYMMPAEIHVLPALPHNQNGKVDEAALRARIRGCTDDR